MSQRSPLVHGTVVARYRGSTAGPGYCHGPPGIAARSATALERYKPPLMCVEMNIVVYFPNILVPPKSLQLKSENTIQYSFQ
jgi:hypothetical protein